MTQDDEALRKLKPCPFCGGDKVRVKSREDDHWAHCKPCFAEGPMCETEAEAIAAWNKRARIQELAANTPGTVKNATHSPPGRRDCPEGDYICRREAEFFKAGFEAARRELTTPPSGDVVERVARIIDPGSWAVMDSYLEQTKRKYAGQNCAYNPDNFKHKESMAIAQAAIAAVPDHKALIVAALTNLRRVGLLQCPAWVIDLIERGDYLEKPHDT